jgi:hypothetical protein
MTASHIPTVPASVLAECLARVAKVESDLFEAWAEPTKIVWENGTAKSQAAIAAELAEKEGKLIAQGMLEVVLDRIQLDLADLGIQVDFPRSPCV